MKICFISAPSPDFLGGISLYVKQLAESLKSDKITWIYKGRENREYNMGGIKCVEIKVPKAYFINEIIFNKKCLKFLENNDFDVINSHAVWGYWMKDYKRRQKQELIHTYHGSAYHFYKNSINRFSNIKRFLLSPILLYSYLIEKPPWKKADEIICVSDHLKKEFESFYGKRKNVSVIRTGVELKDFKPREKGVAMKRLGLSQENFYGLYVGRGGYWTKGLDKIINLSEEIYSLDKNYRLLVIGSDLKKVSHLIKKDFIKFIPLVERDQMPYYYNSAELFFSMSRKEGGAPSMVTSEALASGCLVITDKEANQEVIFDEENGLLIKTDYLSEAKRILRILRNRAKLKGILGQASKTSKKLSVQSWRKSYKEILKRGLKK